MDVYDLDFVYEEDEPPTFLSFSLDIAPGRYNQVGLAMYELPNLVIAWALFLLRPRSVTTPTSPRETAGRT